MKKDVTAKLAACEASLKRWQTRLKRAVSKVNELDRQRRRLQGQMGPVNLHELIGPPKKPPASDVTDISFAEMTGADLRKDDTAIPAFLNRADPLIAEKMTAARKKAEAAARSAMPLTGKAALEAIRPKRRAKA
jgi:hypothetical protein